MLAQALKVVEAARLLGPQPGNIGLYRFTCEPRMLAARIRELAETIEAFDRHSGRSVDAESKLVAAIGYATGKGLDLHDMLASLGMSEEDLKALGDPDLQPKPGEMGPPDDVEDVSVSRQAVRNGAAVLGKDIVLADRYRHDDFFPGDPEASPEGITAEDHPIDPLTEPDTPAPPPPPPEEVEEEAAPEGEPVLQELENRLQGLEARYGWTEELQKADLMLRKARGAMDAKEGSSGTVYRINAESVRALVAVSLAIAELERGVDLDEGFEGPAFR